MCMVPISSLNFSTNRIDSAMLLLSPPQHVLLKFFLFSSLCPKMFVDVFFIIIFVDRFFCFFFCKIKVFQPLSRLDFDKTSQEDVLHTVELPTFGHLTSAESEELLSFLTVPCMSSEEKPRLEFCCATLVCWKWSKKCWFVLWFALYEWKKTLEV